MSQKLNAYSKSHIIDLISEGAQNDSTWVFDCDGTLIRGDIASLSAWALIRLGIAHAEILPKEYEDFKRLPFTYESFKELRQIIIQQKGIQAIYEWETYLHAGLPPKTSYDTAQFAVREGLKNKHLGFLKPVSELASKNKQNAWIVSGSPDMCVWAIADHLEIPHERVLGTRLETVDGIFSPKIMAPGVVWEDLKRQVLLAKNVSKPYFVAGDTIGDWQMFEMATTWCWCVVWGPYRHRGNEFREVLQERILGRKGPQLPLEPGYYLFEAKDKNWVFEVIGEK